MEIIHILLKKEKKRLLAEFETYKTQQKKIKKKRVYKAIKNMGKPLNHRMLQCIVELKVWKSFESH